MLADTTVSVVVSVCDHGNVVRSPRGGCPSTSAQTSIPPFPMEPDNSYVTRLGLNSGTACGPRTLVTGGGGEDLCTFHLNTAPKERATPATTGCQTRAKTVLPRERGLTPSPFGIRSPTSCSRFVPDPGARATPLGHISTRLRSVAALSTLRCGGAEWRGLWRSTWGSARGM